jgi:TrmH family RNA methyltransferase
MLNTPGDRTRRLKPIKWYKDLTASKGRMEAGAFLVEGSRAIKQVISSSPQEIMEIISAQELPPLYHNYATRYVTENQLNSISSARTPQEIIALVRMPGDTYSGQLPEVAGTKVLLLEDVQDPGNVGTLIRTAAAFDFTGVILTEKCADPLSPKCVQSSAGTVLSLWIRRTACYLELVEGLKHRGYVVVAADLGGAEDHSVLQDRDRLLLALGNEASGLSVAMLEAADHTLIIPIDREKAESLNVAACGAICMYLSCIRKI